MVRSGPGSAFPKRQSTFLTIPFQSTIHFQHGRRFPSERSFLRTSGASLGMYSSVYACPGSAIANCCCYSTNQESRPIRQIISQNSMPRHSPREPLPSLPVTQQTRKKSLALRPTMISWAVRTARNPHTCQLPPALAEPRQKMSTAVSVTQFSAKRAMSCTTAANMVGSIRGRAWKGLAPLMQTDTSGTFPRIVA